MMESILKTISKQWYRQLTKQKYIKQSSVNVESEIRDRYNVSLVESWIMQKIKQPKDI